MRMVMWGFRLTQDEAQKLEAMARQTGLKRSRLVRELVQRARVEELVIPASPDPEEATPAPST
jgi:predicted DNA-binding protein